MPTTDQRALTIKQARAFLGGQRVMFADADRLWRSLKKADELSLSRRVLERMRGDAQALSDGLPSARAARAVLCQQEALLTSKDPELGVSYRHDRALKILEGEFDVNDASVGHGPAVVEWLGIAAGILKRRWADLGNPDDLRRAGRLYAQAAVGGVGADAYAQINAAFVDDLLAAAGDDPDTRRASAAALRRRILDELPAPDAVEAHSRWFNAASRAEALAGLRRYREAAAVLRGSTTRPEPWELETTARQLATLVGLHEARAWESPDVRDLLDALLPGAPDAARSVMIGRVGLALSGGGFRAAFYHLGVLARLAELNVLRHVDVLSCVSGGSIVGMCYWLMLRRRLAASPTLSQQDYVALVTALIAHVEQAVASNLRGAVSEPRFKAILRLWRERGLLSVEDTAEALEDAFYRPLWDAPGPIRMHDLPFTPAGAPVPGGGAFNPGRHNWMRADKVPALVINATTINTGHAWQFTPTWMGESPWAIHEAADSIPRLQWEEYQSPRWEIGLGRAVAASACVPGVFTPLKLATEYEGIDVHLVDGGVHDNQGTVSLLAHNCNVLIVSDACGQLQLAGTMADGTGVREAAKALLEYANRALGTAMERVRLANFADLEARRRSGLLQGLLFLHMKAGLDAEPIRLPFAQEAYGLRRAPLSPSGIRKDFQQALAELRTDLDAFTPDEARALMACGYQMTHASFASELASMTALWDTPTAERWPFADHLEEITSLAATTPRRQPLLDALRRGSAITT